MIKKLAFLKIWFELQKSNEKICEITLGITVKIQKLSKKFRQIATVKISLLSKFD